MCTEERQAATEVYEGVEAAEMSRLLCTRSAIQNEEHGGGTLGDVMGHGPGESV